MKSNVLKSKDGFILLWTMVIVMVFFSWVSMTLKMHHDKTLALKRKAEISERIHAETLMRKKLDEGDAYFEFEGKHIRMQANLSDKKIIVNVDGTTKINYVYAIMEDESLVLVTTEE